MMMQHHTRSYSLRCIIFLCAIEATIQWATTLQHVLPVTADCNSRSQRFAREGTVLFTSDSTIKSSSFGKTKKASYSSSSTLLRALKFDGAGVAEVTISLPNNAPSDRSLPAFLRSFESNALLLGAKTYKPVNDSRERNPGGGSYDEYWEVSQPPIEWFGTRLVSTFINRINRSQDKNSVTISIEEARTDIVSAKQERNNGSSSSSSNRVNIMSNIMGRSTFMGGTELTWIEVEQKQNEWILKADLKLTLTVDVPNFLPLPPGFNTIGSQIVGSTCRTRIKENIQGIREAYIEWATRGAEFENDNGPKKNYDIDNIEDTDPSSKLDDIPRSGTLDAYLP